MSDYIRVLPGDLGFTARELEVLQLKFCGLSMPQIAKRLTLSKRTVATHLESVRQRLGVHTTEDAVKVALDLGLVPVVTNA